MVAGGEAVPRKWVSLRGKHKEERLTDLETWFMEFSAVRNAIIHDGELGQAEFRYPRQNSIYNPVATQDRLPRPVLLDRRVLASWRDKGVDVVGHSVMRSPGPHRYGDDLKRRWKEAYLPHDNIGAGVLGRSVTAPVARPSVKARLVSQDRLQPWPYPVYRRRYARAGRLEQCVCGNTKVHLRAATLGRP